MKMLSELYVTKYKSDIEEILTHNSIDDKRMCEILYALRDMNGVDVEILRRTQIEICINSVRKTCKKSSKIMRATKNLLQKWKKIANDESESTRRRESESGFKMPGESCVYRLVYKEPESSAETKTESESESVQIESESVQIESESVQIESEFVQIESESKNFQDYESEFKMPGESYVYPLVYKEPESSAETKTESESVQIGSESKNFQDYESEFKMPGESYVYPLVYKEPESSAETKTESESVQIGSESKNFQDYESEFKMPGESCVYRLVYKEPESSAETKTESESVQIGSESKNFQDYESEFKMPGKSCIYPLIYKEPGTSAKTKAQTESVQNKSESKNFQESESALQRCRAYEPYALLTDIKYNSDLLPKLYSDSSSEIPKPIVVRRVKRKLLDNKSESEFKLKKSKTRRRLVLVDSSDDEFESESKSEYLNDDKFRQKSIEMLTSALKSNESNPNTNEESEKSYRLLRIATTIEACIFNEYSDSTDKRYKSKVRSRVMNLRDRNNPDFRRNVISGHVTPAQAASMSVEAMASSKLKELRKTIEEQTLKEHELQDGSEFLDKSSMFACPECQRRDSSYTISLSMTSLMCNKCGYHWKNV